jgi:flagellar hook-associated protein 2
MAWLDMELGLSGLASGFDWRTLVDQLSEVERAPQRRLLTEQTKLQQRNSAYGSIKTQLGVLRNKITALKEASLFNSRLSTVGDSSVLTAAVTSSAVLGATTFNITQLATAASHQGATNAGTKLNSNNNVSGLVLSNAAFATAVTPGTFTVNGKQVTIATTDTLQQVFDKISTATSGAVTGSYNNGTDRITLGGSSTIVLGSATDTSNFLAAARLYNNGTSSVASNANLGVVKTGATLATANFTTAVTDGGAGAGEFKINGVSIAFNATTDSVTDVLNRINNSTAGVTASYDSLNDRFTLANKGTGDVGIALQDVTGNFLAASKLSTGTLTRGKNLLYTVNGGSQLISQSNTITEATSGVPGVSATALKVGSTTVTVTSDTAKVKTAINDFITEYNKTQSMIDSQTASTTDAKGKVTTSALTGESDAAEIGSRLRSAAFGQVSGLAGAMDQLADLGISTNGNDNSVTLASTDALDAALAENLNAVRDLFTGTTNGLAVSLDAYLEKTIGDDGTLVTKQENLTKQATGIDTQVADLERLVLANRERLIQSFVAMETAQARINQQMQYLQQRFGGA